MSIIDIDRYSSLNKLLRITAVIRKISNNKTFKCNINDITSQDIQDALRCWILYVQQTFRKDWKKQFKRLGPMMGADKIIKVGRRISDWLKQNWDTNFLIALPFESPFSKLVVLSAHCTNHDSIDASSESSKKYWIPKFILTCFTTRALFLDIACGYDTDSFLLVLRRFVTIRGCPKQIRFDAGHN